MSTTRRSTAETPLRSGPFRRVLGQTGLFLIAAAAGYGLWTLGPELAVLALLALTAGALTRAAGRHPRPMTADRTAPGRGDRAA